MLLASHSLSYPGNIRYSKQSYYFLRSRKLSPLLTPPFELTVIPKNSEIR
jgi:hypothetical protein